MMGKKSVCDNRSRSMDIYCEYTTNHMIWSWVKLKRNSSLLNYKIFIADFAV